MFLRWLFQYARVRFNARAFNRTAWLSRITDTVRGASALMLVLSTALFDLMVFDISTDCASALMLVLSTARRPSGRPNRRPRARPL